MNFFSMMVCRADPFAVYQAERKLSEVDMRIPRKRLVETYLAMGQLDSLIECADSQRFEKPEQLIEAAIVKGPDLGDESKFVAPFKMGLTLTAFAMPIVGIAVGWYLLQLASFISQTTYIVIGGIVALIVITSFLYAYLGAYIGRKKANNAIVGMLIVILIGMVYAATRMV